MKKNFFRPVDFWKSVVMTMPDNSFFELMRSVFGAIKTPFKKQQLVNDLESFLLREDIQKAITAYIDQNDAKIIAAVSLLGEPALAELENFFSGELNFAQIQDITVNLEERFILYRFKEEKTSRLALNPVLEQVLINFTADAAEFPRALLFPEIPVKSETEGYPPAPNAILNDRILAGLYSFVFQNECFFKSEGVIRKQVIKAGELFFPGIDLTLVFGCLQILGLFYIDGERLVPDKKCLDDFGLLSPRERGEYCAAALLVYGELKPKTEIIPPIFRGRIRDISNFIHRFMDSLETGFLYPEQFLKRQIEILRKETGIVIANNTLLEALEKTGLLVTVSEQNRQLGAAAENSRSEKTEGAFISIDSGSSILVYPEIEYDDVMKLAAIMNIREAGEVVRFEIDKDSVVRAFDMKTGADEIVELLKRLSGDRVNDTLIWNLKDWEKRHSEVSLKKGIVLSLSEDRRYLVETMPLAGLIIETLAPGLYLLPESAMNKAASALKFAGIDIIAHSHEKQPPAMSTYRYFPKPSSNNDYYYEKTIQPEEHSVPYRNFSKPQKNEDAASSLTANFHALLKNISLSETGRAELSNRIDRRLVLCEAQLGEANTRYEKLEARHMDYAGKQNIARQAISQRSPVEIVWPGAGVDKGFLGIPSALEKENGELVLVFNPAGKDEVMRIPLAKIRLLRRIKKSIFET